MGSPIRKALGCVAMPQGAADGVCLEETWAYVPQKKAGDEAQGPPPNGAEAEAANHTLVGPQQLGPRDSAAICAALDAGQPVAISVPVYNNWSANPAANALGLIPMPLPNSVRKGGSHAMCAMGYGSDPDFAGGRYLILRNPGGLTGRQEARLLPGYEPSRCCTSNGTDGGLDNERRYRRTVSANVPCRQT